MSHCFGGRPSVLYENRYCDKNEFDIIICNEDKENKDSSNSFIQIESVDVKCNNVLISTSANRYYAKTAVIGSDIFVLGGFDLKIKKKFLFILNLDAPGKV